MESILQRLANESRLAFSALFTPPHNRSRLVGLFLAILELIKGSQVLAEQPEAYGEIWMRLAPPPSPGEQPAVETTPS